jgi:tetratricopeptide (TPR) repeat protein
MRLASSVPPSPAASLSLEEEWNQKGATAWEEGRLEAALEAYKSAGSSADALYNVGTCHMALGQHKEAIEAWKASLTADPSRADVHINLANLLVLAQRDTSGAKEHYEQALALTPDDGQAHYNYGLLLDTLGNLEEAISHFQSARKCGIEQADKPLRNALAKFIGQTASASSS